MTITSSKSSSSGENIDAALSQGSGDAIIDIESRTTTLVSKDLERKFSITLYLDYRANLWSTVIVS